MNLQDIATWAGLLVVGVTTFGWWLRQTPDIQFGTAIAVGWLGMGTLAALWVRDSAFETATAALRKHIPLADMGKAMSELDAARGDYTLIGYIAAFAAVTGIALSFHAKGR